MISFLVDTSVLSLLAPNRRDLPAELRQWISERDRELFISAISIAEVEQGIAKLRRQGGSRTADSIKDWIDSTVDHFGPNILPFDVPVAQAAGRMSDRATAIGRHPGVADLYIAATAEVHDLTVLTRNTRHFLPLGVAVLDPLSELPN